MLLGWAANPTRARDRAEDKPTRSSGTQFVSVGSEPEAQGVLRVLLAWLEFPAPTDCCFVSRTRNAKLNNYSEVVYCKGLGSCQFHARPSPHLFADSKLWRATPRLSQGRVLSVCYSKSSPPNGLNDLDRASVSQRYLSLEIKGLSPECKNMW